jgi:hypothetical protein
VVDAQRGEQAVEVVAVLDKRVRRGVGRRQLPGVAHPDEIGHDASSEWQDVRHDVAPQVGRSRVAVEEHDRVAVPFVDVGHRYAVDDACVLLERQCRVDHGS